MVHDELGHALNALVAEYGFEQVRDCLHGKWDLDCKITQPLPVNSRESANVSKVRKRSRPTAPEYVANMELAPEKADTISQLAERFHAKSFLPSFGDVTNFCQHYNIDVPASKSRVGAIARVFKFLASMDPEDAREIADYQMFSGPSSLGPIADAIRRNGRARSSSSKATDDAATSLN